MSHGTPLLSDRSRQLRDVLRSELRAHGVDFVLPDEHELGQDLGATRNAVREALELLRAEGLIERRRGRGTRLIASRTPHRLDRLQGLTESLCGGAARSVVNDVRAAEIVSAPLAISAALALRPGDPVLMIERLRSLDGEALALDTSYFNGVLAQGLLDVDLAGTDLLVLLEDVLGLALADADVMIEATAADSGLAETLGLRVGAPILSLDRVLRLTNRLPLAIEFLRMRGDRITLTAASAHRTEAAS